MYLLFCKLKKAKKHKFNFFKLEKAKQKHEFTFLQATKAKRHEY